MAKKKDASVYFDRAINEFVGLDQPQMDSLKKTFPQIDVERELGKMKAWLALTQKGKRRTGNIAFILNWLSNTTGSSVKEPEIAHTELLESTSPLRPVYLEYLKCLWKNRQHILEMNKRI